MTSTIIIPTDMDVLCGKDQACLQHKGSRDFRKVIDSYVPKYATCKTKFEKMNVTREIYQVVNQKSRFLKFNEADQVWEEITAMAARDKIGHSLRFSSRAKRRHKNNKKGAKCHRRSGSDSSAATAATASSSGSESMSSPFDRDTLVSLFQSSAAANQPVLVEEETASSFSPSNESSFFGGLDDFLNIELSVEQEGETDIMTSILFEDEAVADQEADPLYIMDDILSAVNDIEDSQSLTLLLLSEPIGEWDEEDDNVQL